MKTTLFNLISKRISLSNNRRMGLIFVFSLFVFIVTNIFVLDLLTEVDLNMRDQQKTSFKTKAHAGKMLIILIDSIQKDIMFSDYMPFLSNFRNSGAWGVSKVIGVPLSVAGDQAIFSGKIENPFISLIKDFQGSPQEGDNLFKRLHEADKRVALFSSACLQGLYGSYCDGSAFQPRKFLFSQYLQDSSYIFDKADAFLKCKQWDVAAIQFITLDYVGHLKTPRSQDYIEACRLIDSYAKKLVSRTDDQDIILITSEHGMDDSGFHTDRKPSVTDTPFILKGPNVKKVGPILVSQIDWAPTLSILLGLSPFYSSYSLPNLDIIEIKDQDTENLLREFNRVMDGSLQSISLEDLRKKRRILIAQKKSLSVALFLFLTVLLSANLLLYLFLQGNNLRRQAPINLKSFIIFNAFLIVLTFIFFSLGKFNSLSDNLPFSANFIMSHPVSILFILALIASASIFYAQVSDRYKHKINEFYILLIFTFIFTFILSTDNPYNLLNWIVVCSLIVGWSISKRSSWLAIFLFFIAGLFIRRLTFYNAYNPIHLPERWMIMLILFIAGMAILWYRLRINQDRRQLFQWGLLSTLPSLLFAVLPVTIDVRAMLMLTMFPFIIWHNKKDRKNTDISGALWVSLLLLGTSSSIELTTHIVIFPIMIAVFASSKETSITTRGILVTLFLWIFYLLPGNSFDLKLLELKDSIIMSNASTGQIENTVFVISSRYIAPIFVITWMIVQTHPQIPLWWLGSLPLLPLILASGIKVFSLFMIPSLSFPWQEYTHIIVLICTIFVILCAYMAIIFCKVFEKIFNLILAKSQYQGTIG